MNLLTGLLRRVQWRNGYWYLVMIGLAVVGSWVAKSTLAPQSITTVTVLATVEMQPPNRDPRQIFQPFGTVTVQPDFEVNGQGINVDSIAFWEAPDPAETRMFVTAKGNQLVEVWQYPFVNNELAPLTHSSFGAGTRANGVVVDQENDRLYVSLSNPASTVSVFSVPQLEFLWEFIRGSVNLKSEPNITLLKHANGQTWAYVSADNIVYIHDAETGAAISQFNPVKGLETLAADHLHQVIYIPDENDMTGIYAYRPDGSPSERNNTNGLGGGGIFQSDAEGILLYTCPSDGGSDSGSGLIVVADQKSAQTDFEFFDRQTWEHLGTLRVEGVSNTDGIASIQRPLPDYPLGIFAAVNDDTSTVGVGWDKVLSATGLSCGAFAPPPSDTPTPLYTHLGADARRHHLCEKPGHRD